MKGPGYIERRAGHPEHSRWTPQPPSPDDVKARGGFIYAWVQLEGGNTVLCRFEVHGKPVKHVVARDFDGGLWMPENVVGCIWPLRPPEAVR